ncbi:uncharacterized protein LOC144180317 isoform X2 [Haemaphysalis longicornis]
MTPARAWSSSAISCPVAGCLVLTLLLTLTPSVEPAKRLDCKAFCRLTGFRFNAGLCKCGYMLFASKRSWHQPLCIGFLGFARTPVEGGYRSLSPAERFQLEVAMPSSLVRQPADAGGASVFDGHAAPEAAGSDDGGFHATATRALLAGHKPDAGPDAEDSFYR